MGFKFDNGDQVAVFKSGEVGEIIGRAEYANGNENQYFVRYVAGDGRSVESWWAESALTVV